MDQHALQPWDMRHPNIHSLKLTWHSLSHLCTVCSAAGQDTELKGNGRSYFSSTASKFQCKHLSTKPQGLKRRPPSTHPTTPNTPPPWGDRPLNSFTSAVQHQGSVKPGSVGWVRVDGLCCFFISFISFFCCCYGLFVFFWGVGIVFFYVQLWG